MPLLRFRLLVSSVVLFAIVAESLSGKGDLFEMDRTRGQGCLKQGGDQTPPSKPPRLALVAIGSAGGQYYHHLTQLITWVSVVNRYYTAMYV